VLEELKGYFKFYAFDCRHEQVAKSQRFSQVCDKQDYLPYFSVIKPAEVRVNPYTGKPMPATNVPYSDNQISVPKIKSYILNNLPDFATTLNTA
jgi:hypothetical protein